MFDPIGFIKNPIVFIRYFQAKRNLKKSRETRSPKTS